MPMLEDGTVIPHYLGTESIGTTGGSTGIKTNVSLRVGEVKEIVFPTDVKSVSKKWIEYRVEVQHKDGSHPGTVTTYPNCWVVNSFGGAADRCTYTLRADTGAGQQSGTTGLGNGSKVLVLCINGDQPNGIIMGGIRDSTDVVDKQSDGHHLLWSFNGFNVQIDDTGELEMKFLGATNPDGSPRGDVKSGAPGSTLKFSDDGSITITQGQQTIIIDTPGQNIKLSSNGYNVKIDGSGTKLGNPSALDAIYKGTSHRLLDQTMNTSLLSALGILAGLLGACSIAVGTAGASISTAAPLLIIPVVGCMLASVPFAAAGVALTSAAAIIGSMVAAVSTMIAAITAYEAGAEATLSLQNFTS